MLADLFWGYVGGSKGIRYSLARTKMCFILILYQEFLEAADMLNEKSIKQSTYLTYLLCVIEKNYSSAI